MDYCFYMSQKFIFHLLPIDDSHYQWNQSFNAFTYIFNSIFLPVFMFS